MPIDYLLLAGAILLVAFLYASVGHAGASGYIAVMSLYGLAPEAIKPAALLLNILVASLATWQFWRAGHFSWALCWPFVITSVPFAFLGGYLHLPVGLLKILLGVVLLFSAARFLFRSREEGEPHSPGRGVSLSVGAGLGFISGMTGVGGGIFLTPLMILMRWARTKTASAISAFFILANSISGLLGNVAATREIPSFALPVAAAALIGGTAGSYLGSRRFSPVIIKRLLGVVLTVAGVKMLLP
jgi:uncharacterized membrane protein YfcA